MGEWATASYGIGKDADIQLVKEMQWPDSLGLLYSAFTYYTGFKVNSGEYKVMGLAPYGQPRYVPLILEHLIDLRDDGSFRLNQEYFGYLTGLTMTNQRFHRLFGGPPRVPESPLTQKEMDLARSVQDVCEEIMLRMARTVHRQTGLEQLCLAGGVALNCVGNGRILREGPFKQIWIQPAAGDAGGALGVAQLVWHRQFRAPRNSCGTRDGMKGAYLGPRFSREEIEQFLRDSGARYRDPGREALLRETAALLGSEKTVGWFSGRMEFGPRALGGRSILGDPRSTYTRSARMAFVEKGIAHRLDPQPPRQLDQLLRLAPIVTTPQSSERHGPIHRPGVEKAEAEPPRQPAGNRTLAGSGRTIDRDDHDCQSLCLTRGQW